MANMMQKLNLDFLVGDKSSHGFYVLIDEISLSSVKPVIEWILESNFSESKPELLNLLICSPGGDLSAAFALIDIMRGSTIPIRTIGLGQIASAGLLIFVAGTKGHRILTPNTSILSHQYSWGAFGKEHELFAQVKEFDLTTKRMINLYKKCTGLNEEQIRDNLLPPQDIWLGADESKKLGLCDMVKDLK
jgi:ATP-dependent Clp protease protease subunit